MAQVVPQTKIYENRWFWVVAFALVILVSAVAGFMSAGGSVEGTIETVTHAAKTNRPILNAPSTREQIRRANVARSFERVLKLIQDGVIQRLHEPSRRLYINDPVWEVMSRGEKAHVAEVVAEYLDWVHDDHTGRVTVHSFRNGSRVAFTQGGIFYVNR